MITRSGFKELKKTVLAVLVYSIFFYFVYNYFSFTELSLSNGLTTSFFLSVYFFFATILLLVVSIVYLIINYYEAVSVKLNYEHYFALAKQKNILFEIKLPNAEPLDPLKMEGFLLGISVDSHELSNISKEAKVSEDTPVFSVEFFADSSNIRMFIMCDANLKQLIATNVYTYFSGAQILACEDYLYVNEFNLEEYKFWGTDWKLENSEEIPLSNYKELLLTKNIDPMKPLFESMVNLEPGEHIGFQTIFRLEKKAWSRVRNTASVFSVDCWKKKKLKGWIEDLVVVTKKNLENTKKTPTISDLKIMEYEHAYSTQKVFETTIRTIYIAKNDVFDPSRLITLMRVYNLCANEKQQLIPILNLGTKGFEDKKMNPSREVFFSSYKYRMIKFKDTIPTLHKTKIKLGGRLKNVMTNSSVFYAPVTVLATLCHPPTEIKEFSKFSVADFRASIIPKNLPLK